MHQSKLILFEAVATLVGTIIGAGILGIPFVFARAGFWTGTLVLGVVGLAMLLMKLMYGEVTLRTRGNHQLVGYTEIYLGKFAKHLMALVLIFSLYGALLAYFIGEGEVIEAITGIPAFWASIGFYALFTFLIYVGLRVIKRTELIMGGLILIIIFIIGLLAFNHIDLSNLAGFDLAKVFVPYGVLVFACSGIVAVPQVRRILARREKLMRRAIIWGCAIPPILYFVFTALVVSISRGQVTEVASVGLGEIVGWQMVLVANIFAFFTMATSFLTLGLALRDIYKFDYKLPHLISWLLLIVTPLIIFLLGARDFVRVIGFVGAVGIGIAGSLEVLTFWLARKKGARKPEYEIPGWLGWIGGAVLILVFMGGMIYALLGG